MSLLTKKTDFTAELRYLTAEEGGRSTRATSGYRPQVKFPFSEMMTSGHQTFIGQDFVDPGETINAEIRILSPQLFENKLETGMKFELREGPHIVAFGQIETIINKDLLK